MDRLKKLHAAMSKFTVQSHGLDSPQESVAIGAKIRLVILIAIFVFLCEALVMIIILFMPALPSWFKILFDSSLLVLLLSPVLYFAVLRPMVQHILAHQLTEDKLKRHGHQLEDLIKQRTSELSDANQTLRQQIRVRAAAENLMLERTFELDDTIRELQCLYAISRLMEKHDISIEELVTKTMGLIPFAWLNPEAIGVRITLDDREFKSDNFIETEQQQTGNIMVHGRCVGVLEVAYLEEIAETKREKSLIEAISERLGGILERIETAGKLRQALTVNAALSDLYKPLIAPSASIEAMAITVLDKARCLTNSRQGYITSIDPLKSGAVTINHTEMLGDPCGVTSQKKMVFPQDENKTYHGLWGQSLNSLDAFFTNSPQEHPAAAGTPAGHIPIRRFLSVPILLGHELVGQIALANKDKDYTDQDLAAILRVAEFYALALQRCRVENALQKSKNELERRVEERTAEIALANKALKEEVEEHKLADQQLQQNRAMLQAVFDGIADPLVLVDRNLMVKIINQAAAKYYGIVTNRDTIGMVFCEAAQKSDIFKQGELPSAVLSNQVLSFERKGFMAPDRLERVFIYPVKEKERNVGDAIIHVTDITEERRIENQLVQSEKMASLGILVSSIAHEINNPNSFVAFNMPILEEYIEALMPFADEYAAKHPDLELFNMSYPEFRTDVIKLLKNIEHGSERISSFVSNLREFAQFDGRRPKNWIDLKSVIDKVLSICGSNIKKNIRCCSICW